MHRRNDRTEPLRRRRRDALPRVRRCTSQRFFLLLLRTRSCAIGAEALSLSCFSICTFFGRAAPDRAGVFGPETSFTLVRIHRLHIALGRKARLAEQNAL